MKRSALLILFLSFFLLAFSCASPRIISKSYRGEEVRFNRNDSFQVNHLIVTSFNFIEHRDVGYIIEQKLIFALRRSGIAIIPVQSEGTEYTIQPELIIKTYDERYSTRHYYMLNVKVAGDMGILCEFSYEYNGASSIFNGRVQDAMIEKFVRDLSSLLIK